MVNTSNVMGSALVVFGVALAGMSGATGDRNTLVLGFVGSVALFYMGIGLYSRGNTATGLLRSSDETTRRASLRRTTMVIAGIAAAGAFFGFAYATVRGEPLYVRGLFGIVFLYTLAVVTRLRNSDTEPEPAEEDADDGPETEAETEAEGEAEGETETEAPAD